MERYIKKLQSATILHQIIPKKERIEEEIYREEEFKQVNRLMAEASVVPEGPEICYHVVAMPWFKRWEEYCTGQT